MIKRFIGLAVILALTLAARASAETTSGTWAIQMVDGRTFLSTHWSDGDHNNSENDHDINPNDYGLANLNTLNGHVTFKKHRDAGDFEYEGWLKNGNGGGTYTFTANDAFFSELSRRGYDVSEISRKMTFANLDITLAYVNSMEAAGYHLDTRELIEFRALKIDQQYLSDMKSAGISDLSARQVVELKALHVDLAYIRDLDSVGFGHMEARQYVEFKAMKIDSAYIKYLGAHGFHNLTPNKVVEMKAMKI